METQRNGKNHGHISHTDKQDDSPTDDMYSRDAWYYCSCTWGEPSKAITTALPDPELGHTSLPHNPTEQVRLWVDSFLAHWQFGAATYAVVSRSQEKVGDIYMVYL